MTKIKAVIDTNIFVRALIGSPANERIYTAFASNGFRLFLSKEMLEELVSVLSRPRLGIAFEDIKALLHLIKLKAIIIEATAAIKACRDPSDDMILKTAISAKANVIVTNDNDLLVLNPFQNVSIVNPHQFLKMLKMI